MRGGARHLATARLFGLDGSSHACTDTTRQHHHALAVCAAAAAGSSADAVGPEGEPRCGRQWRARGAPLPPDLLHLPRLAQKPLLQQGTADTRRGGARLPRVRPSHCTQAYFHQPQPGVHHHTPRRNPSNPSMLSWHPLCGAGRWHGTIVRRAWSWTATIARSSTCLRATWPAWAARRRLEARRARRLRRAACSNAPSLAADHAATHWSVQRRACLPGQPSGPEGRARNACMPKRGYGGARVPAQSWLSHLTAFVTAQAPMPTKVEDVDKFMQDLAAAAQGRRPPDDEAEAVEGEPSARI